MPLAILVVYFLDEAALPILNLHLDAIARRTTLPYVIYAAAPRVSERIRQRLMEQPQLRLFDFRADGLTGSREHSALLDQLVRQAISDGCEQLCTMDVDAFPVVDAWNEVLASEIARGQWAVAVFRAENGDTALPHPSCCWFPAELVRRHGLTFLPEPAALFSGSLGEFLSATGQRPDSGIGLGWLLWSEGLPWTRLTRTNAIDDHYLMAGVYGDIVFHLGAMSWADRDFRGDRQGVAVLRLLDAVEALMRRHGWFVGRAAAIWHSLSYRFSRSLVARTNATFSRIAASLSRDPDAYIARLRGRSGGAQAAEP